MNKEIFDIDNDILDQLKIVENERCKVTSLIKYESKNRCRVSSILSIIFICSVIIQISIFINRNP